MRLFLLALVLLPLAGTSHAPLRDGPGRASSAAAWSEVTLPNDARVDCTSETHAIEVDFSEKWAEALGQVLL